MNHDLAEKFERATTDEGIGLVFSNAEYLEAARALRAEGSFTAEDAEDAENGPDRGNEVKPGVRCRLAPEKGDAP